MNSETYIWQYMCTHVIGEDIIFLISQRRTGGPNLEFENATFTIFNQPEIECSKLLQLRTGNLGEFVEAVFM